MAKYGRFDPRNKKNGRNKNRSLGKDIRIREADNHKIKHQAFLREVVYDDDNWGTSYLEESVGGDRKFS